jgi:anti-sigma B factor antagonist
VATPLELSTRASADGIPVVTVAGEIDMSNAGRFRDALGLAAAAVDGGSFVVDLTGVEYLDSAGVHVLSRTRRGSGSSPARCSSRC